jgi:hypothetical protein
MCWSSEAEAGAVEIDWILRPTVNGKEVEEAEEVQLGMTGTATVGLKADLDKIQLCG